MRRDAFTAASPGLPPRVLLLPGWRNSGPGHWQTLWQQQHGFERVEQADWDWPRRGDWMARLDEVLLAEERPAVLVAHSLGCQLVAGWAEHSRHTARVQAALLVAPADTERPDLPPQLFNWRPMRRSRLPFPATLVASGNDPHCSLERARSLAQDWGASLVDIGLRGALDGNSGLADWPEGLALLHALLPCAS